MKKIMHVLFLSCLKASEMIEKKLHFGLTLTEIIQLKLHKMMCDACSRYEKQSVFLDKGIGSLRDKKGHDRDLEDLKKQIHKKLSDTNH